MAFHDRVTYGGDAFEKILRKGRGRPWQRLYKYLEAYSEPWLLLQDRPIRKLTMRELGCWWRALIRSMPRGMLMDLRGAGFEAAKSREDVLDGQSQSCRSLAWSHCACQKIRGCWIQSGTLPWLDFFDGLLVFATRSSQHYDLKYNMCTNLTGEASRV